MVNLVATVRLLGFAPSSDASPVSDRDSDRVTHQRAIAPFCIGDSATSTEQEDGSVLMTPFSRAMPSATVQAVITGDGPKPADLGKVARVSTTPASLSTWTSRVLDSQRNPSSRAPRRPTRMLTRLHSARMVAGLSRSSLARPLGGSSRAPGATARSMTGTPIVAMPRGAAPGRASSRR